MIKKIKIIVIKNRRKIKTTTVKIIIKNNKNKYTQISHLGSIKKYRK